MKRHATKAAIASIMGFRFDYALIGLGGFDDDGAPMDFDLEKIAVRQAAMGRARQSIALADRTKFEQTGTARVAPPEAQKPGDQDRAST